MTAIPDVSDKSLAALISLSGRRAIVTGAARGLGKAIARRLAEGGADVLLADVNAKAVAAAAEDLSSMCEARVISVCCDVTDSAAIAHTADTAVNEFGGIDIWVNNAGIFPSTPLLELGDEEWDKVLAVNLRGVFVGCRESARRMIAAGQGGVIVNIASLAGIRGIGSRLSSYVASKHGVCGLTRQLALELAPESIRVLAVAPGVTITEGVLESVRNSPKVPEMTDNLDHRNFGRAGVPDDIARAVFFCASDLSIFMTGQTIVVDAGESV